MKAEDTVMGEDQGTKIYLKVVDQAYRQLGHFPIDEREVAQLCAICQKHTAKQQAELTFNTMK